METVNDIIREMRGTRPDCDDCLSNHTCEYLIRFANRLDAAYKRDLQAMVDAGDIDMRTATDEVARLRAALYSDGDFGRLLKERDIAIERLKAALKPVQDAHIPDFSICDTCRDRSECEKNENGETCEWYDIVEAVRNAQRIYNGGES